MTLDAPLPTATSTEGWDALCADDAALSGGVRAIARPHGLAARAAQRYDSGSLPVLALDDRHVLKLYPPHEGEHASVERRVLGFVQGRLPIPTPEVVASGTQDGWHYLLMSRLHGPRLVDAWPELGAADRDRLGDALGEAVAAMHALDASPLHGLPPDWDAFMREQRDSAAERQRARRLDERWVEQIPDFLDRHAPGPPARRVLLHTELMREHLLVERGAQGWTPSGLFDFEPAMLGDPEYDFASFGLFVACGDARLLRRSLLAYGMRADALDGVLACRLMAHAILHRYSHLRWYLERLPAAGETTLEALAQRWWAFDDAGA